MASYLRNMIIRQAFNDCIRYIESNKSHIVVPQFLIKNKQELEKASVRKRFPKDTNNKVLDREGIKAKCITTNCGDSKRKVKKLFTNK